jgi:tetratricopeptide (TPR) repeat protein
MVPIILLSLVAQTAAPDPDQGPKAAARDLLVKGQSLYEKGDYAGALDKFNQAYAAYPSPKIWFNIGNASMNLGRDLEALGAFGNFLTLAADEPADKRAHAEKQVAKLKSRLGQLNIECNLAGAEVTLDGRRVGVTPLQGPVWTTAGQHQVVVTHANAAPATRTLELGPGRPQLVQIDLAPAERARPSSRVAPPTQADRAAAHAANARRLYDAGDYGGAIAEMEAELRLSADPSIFYNIGQAYRRWGMRERAVAAYKQYLGQVPQASNRQQVEKQIAELEGSMAPGNQPPAPASPPAANSLPPAREHEARAAQFYRAGRYGEAIAELEAEYALDANPVVLFNLGQTYRFWGKSEEAIRAYRHYLAQAPQAANRWEAERAIAEIRNYLDRTVYRGPQGAPPNRAAIAQEHGRRANLSYQAGNFAEAVRELEAEYVVDGDPSALYNLGQAYRLWGKLEPALRAYRQYLAERPGASNRQQVEKLIADLQGSLARQDGAPGR